MYTKSDIEMRLRAAKPDMVALEFRPGGKYIVLVDPTVVDFEMLPDMAEADGLGFEVQFLAMVPATGKSLKDGVAAFTEPQVVLA